MSYTLAACFAPAEVIRATVLPEGSHSRSIGFGLVLVDLSDATRGGSDPRRHPLFLSLTAETAAWLSSLARTGPVAYAEAEYWAGIGWQAAAGWRDGALVLGPVFDTNDPDERDRVELADPAPGGAINLVLEWLGVRPARGKDAFDTVALGDRRGDA